MAPRRPRDPSAWVASLGAVAALAALVAGVVADAPRPDAVADGLILRAALVVVALVGLAVHGSVLRGSGREVLALLPVDPVDVVAAELVGVGWTAARAVVGAAIALAPLWWAWPALAAPGVAVIAAAAAASVGASSLALLGAIAVAEDPAWAPALDAVRGANPRAQAALIYALTPVVLGLGGLAAVASAGAVAAAKGSASGWLGTAALAACAPILLARVPSAARASWFQATLVLSEIRARYQGLVEAREALHVALDWTVRWLPARVARHALLDLRFGWRERRGRLVGAWAVAVAAVSVAWSGADRGVALGGALAGGGAWLGAAVVIERARLTHPWLRSLLADPIAEAAARAWCVVGWAAGPVALLAALVVLDAGWWAGSVALAAGLAHAGVAGAAAAAARGGAA
jgi:hypothetical protein